MIGVGGGLLNPVIGDVALSVVPKERSGMAAGIMDTFRQVGVSVGVAVWGAVFVARGADKVSALAAGTPAASGDHPRQLVEATSSGELGRAVAGLPPHAHDVVVNAAREGFLSGFNEVLVLGGVVCFVGAALALWLVREHEIEREPVESGEAQGRSPCTGQRPPPDDTGKEQVMSEKAAEHSSTEVIDTVSEFLVGGGILTMALFPLAIPIVALLIVAALPLLAAGAVLAVDRRGRSPRRSSSSGACREGSPRCARGSA